MPEILVKTDVLVLLGISERLLENWVRDGKFPRPVRLGKRVVWHRDAVDQWKRLTFAHQFNFDPQLGQLP
ncbi:hypothetical protein PTE30175_03583 [Pandoraea terrae]|uniref:Uncharacterized protein n=1 Tax=Pandoraea terrae TaxID=1537710 RepID=A0A5E4X5V6_9BURK|nr:AlpA family phage regulatory protein [Pandoraea terrae]VVE31590.1 hypothetical protein PTE30175_03583 [Pandoraea terrae]